MGIFKRVKVLFTLLKADIQLRYAAREADRKNRKRNERYYVIPNYDHKLITCNRREIHKYRTDGYFDHRVKMEDFKRECFYYTPYANGRSPIEPLEKDIKRKQWLNYVLQAKGLV